MNIFLTGIAGNVNLEVTDLLGHIVYANKYDDESSKEIYLNEKLTPGMYTVAIHSSNLNVIKKFIVL